MNVSVSNNSAASLPNQEFSIRVPKFDKRKFSILRFNNNDMDFTKLGPVNMERENNKNDRARGEVLPKYGAGSEYLREEKEEARRRRYGMKTRDYNPDDQPWILKLGHKDGKKYRGVREGGVNENASYYVFMQGTDGSIEAYPVAEWYNFQAIQRFKALSAEEAEQEFGKRNKSFNFFNLMMRKRFRNEEEDEHEDENKNKRVVKKDLKISEMEDWIDSDDDDDGESDNDGDEDKKEDNKKKKKDKKKQAITKKNDSDGSALEESDDGDEEGRELDYISDSSLSISDTEAKTNEELKGVSDENALRNLLESDEDEDEENNTPLENGVGDDAESEETALTVTTVSSSASVSSLSSTPETKKGKKRLNDGKSVSLDNSSEISTESSESESDKLRTENLLESAITNNDINFQEPSFKKLRCDSGITEEAIRRYLARKPMTAKQLLQKFKKSKSNISSDQLVSEISYILKRINPRKQTIQNQMYLSLMPDNTHR